MNFTSDRFRFNRGRLFRSPSSISSRPIKEATRQHRTLAGPYKYFKVKYYSLITESVAVTTTNC
jgi:hypothetical protein